MPVCCDMKIGFFDSGLGGLTILKTVAAALPQYAYEYYGDTKNLPYGDKTEEEVYELTKQGVAHLFENDCALVIIACNTASAETLRRLQDSFLPQAYPERRILGVIIPTVETVVAANVQSVAIIATQRTVDSKKYEREFAKFTPALRVCSVATPGLVPLLEAGERSAAIDLLTDHIEHFYTAGITGLILGCTHYTLLTDLLTTQVQGRIQIFSQDAIIPQKLATYLARHPEIQSSLTNIGGRNVYLSVARPEYDPIITHLLDGAMV